VPDEDEKERLDRELIELLNELRVAIPGIQIIFAFLLTVPFTQRFGRVTEFQQDVYFVTLLCAAAASAFLIAPSAYHRLRWRQHDKYHMLVISNYLAIVGLAFLALAMIGTVMLITDVLFETGTVIVITAGCALLFAGLWYALPLSRRVQD
jgi:membrane-bound acyltransferase YfiQ involved in biofilm formation